MKEGTYQKMVPVPKKNGASGAWSEAWKRGISAPEPPEKHQARFRQMLATNGEHRVVH